MPTLYPQDRTLQDFVEYYWVLDRSESLILHRESVLDFPSMSPEVILLLRGHLDYTYRGRTQTAHKSILFGYIGGGVLIDPAALHQGIIIKFKDRGLAAVAPFLQGPRPDIFSTSVTPAAVAFGPSLLTLEARLRNTPLDEAGPLLDTWLHRLFDANRPGIVYDLRQHLHPTASVQDLLTTASTSPSSLTRYFRSCAGITPKHFLMRIRFAHVHAELFSTGNTDWFHYVAKYGYHDQNHLIKEVKRFSGWTPTQLAALPLMGSHRPEQVVA